MPSDFDFASTEEEAVAEVKAQELATASKPVAAPVAVPAPPTEPVTPTVEREMDEIELRMAKAQFYWELLGRQLLDTDDPLALEVEEEIRTFLKSKLAEIMGAPAPKKRGRKPQVAPAVARPVAMSRPIRKPAPRLTSVPSAAATPKSAEGDVVSIIEAPDGSKKEKIYRRAVDPDSQKVYYRGYDKVTVDGVTELVGDGNKYELAVNVNGGQYFRVLSQQALLPGVKHSTPSTPAQISAASEEHARVTLAAARRNPLLQAMIDMSQK